MKRIKYLIILLFVSLGLFARSICASASAQSEVAYAISEDNTYNFFDVVEDTSETYNIKASMDYLVSSSYYDYETLTDVCFASQFSDYGEGEDDSNSTGTIYYLNFSVKYNPSDGFLNVTIFMAKDSDFSETNNDYTVKEIIYKGVYNTFDNTITTTYHHYGLFIPFYTDEDGNDFQCHGSYDRYYYCPSSYSDEVKTLINSSDMYFRIFSCIFVRNYSICGYHYTGHDYYYLVDYDNIVTIDYIKSQITAGDDTYGDLTSSIRTLYSEYDGTTQQECGEYILMFGVSDLVLNSSYLKLIVRICDIDSPVIETNGDIEVGAANGTLDEDDVLEHISITDNDKVTSVSVDLSEYEDNKSTLGTYSVNVTAIDDDENETTAVVSVTVVDDTAPKIKFTTNNGYRYFIGTTEDVREGQLSEEFLYSIASVTDDYDDSPTLVINGIENVDFENPVSSSYTLTYVATDSSGNQTSVSFSLLIYDQDYPYFNTADMDTRIVLDAGLKLTKDQILSVLTKYLDSTKVVAEIESSYFEEEYPVETYLFTVLYEDGTQELLTISFDSSDDVSYEKTTEESDNTYIYIILGVSIGVILLAIGGYFIFKRLKKNR